MPKGWRVRCSSSRIPSRQLVAINAQFQNPLIRPRFIYIVQPPTGRQLKHSPGDVNLPQIVPHRGRGSGYQTSEDLIRQHHRVPSATFALRLADFVNMIRCQIHEALRSGAWKLRLIHQDHDHTLEVLVPLRPGRGGA